MTTVRAVSDDNFQLVRPIFAQNEYDHMADEVIDEQKAENEQEEDKMGEGRCR